MSHLGARFASESASFDPMTGFFNKQTAYVTHRISKDSR